MASNSPYVVVLLEVDGLLDILHHFVSLTLSGWALSMGPPSEFDSEHGVEHDAVVVAAGIDAFPSHCVLVLLLPSLGDEAVDLGSACEAEPIHVSMLSLLELDDPVLLELGSAGTYGRSDLVEVLDEDSQFLG